MRICIEESTYEGTPIEILTQLRALHFDAGTFDGTEGDTVKSYAQIRLQSLAE